jgi:hypothetical protein
MSLTGGEAIAGIGELRPTRYTESETTIGMLAKATLNRVQEVLGFESESPDHASFSSRSSSIGP